MAIYLKLIIAIFEVYAGKTSVKNIVCRYNATQMLNKYIFGLIRMLKTAKGVQFLLFNHYSLWEYVKIYKYTRTLQEQR